MKIILVGLANRLVIMNKIKYLHGFLRHLFRFQEFGLESFILPLFHLSI